MALRGSYYTGFGGYFRLQLEWTATQNIQANTSTVTSKLYLISLSSYSTISSSSTNSLRIEVDGTHNNGSFNPSLSGNQKKLIHTATNTISHNSSGAKTVAFGGFADINVSISGSYVGRVNLPDRNYTLNKIPRHSNLRDRPSFNIKDGFKFDINRASSDFKHRVKIYFEGQLISQSAKDRNIYWDWTPSTSEINQMTGLIPNSKSGTTRAVLETYKDGTLMGTTERTGTGTLTDAEPIFDYFIYSDENPATGGLFGSADRMIESLSELKIEIPYSDLPEPKDGATLEKYTLIVGDKTITKNYDPNDVVPSFQVGNVEQNGTVTVSLSIEDSRGFKTKVTRNIRFIEYDTPSVIVKAERANGFEDSVTVTIKGNYSPVKDNGSEKNGIRTIQYGYKKKSSSNLSWNSIPTSQYQYNNGRYEVQDFQINLSNNDEWEIAVRVRDDLTTYERGGAEVQEGVPPWLFEGEGNIRYKGALIQTGNEKTLSDNGRSVSRYQGQTGTPAGLRAMKMGDNSTGYYDSTDFPYRQGAWVYFQSSDQDGDFFLWKSRQDADGKLHVGNVKNGRIGDVEEIDFVVERGTNSYGDYIKYANGRMDCFMVDTQTLSFGGSDRPYRAYSDSIRFPKSFVGTPVITANGNYGEIMGFGIRNRWDYRVEFVIYSWVQISNPVEITVKVSGFWK